MDSFAQIFQRLPTGNTSSSSGGVASFKVQIKFDIPIFKVQMDLDVVDKWLNMLEGYFSIHNFSSREKITFSLLKAIPHVKYWWDTFSEKKEIEEPSLFTVTLAWESFKDAIKEQYYHVGSYDDLYRRWTTLRQERDQTVPDLINIFHTMCPSWIKNILSDIWCSSITSICIDTSRNKQNLWTYLPWAWPIYMLSKLRKTLNKRCDSLGHPS